ncbi:hypothetical protein F5B21DRAFT_506108 [Xylaria acuta]|nr:hypothetical protein F5B21DRAFT_506108 [Xylaria acuta]
MAKVGGAFHAFTITRDDSRASITVHDPCLKDDMAQAMSSGSITSQEITYSLDTVWKHYPDLARMQSKLRQEPSGPSRIIAIEVIIQLVWDHVTYGPRSLHVETLLRSSQVDKHRLEAINDIFVSYESQDSPSSGHEAWEDPIKQDDPFLSYASQGDQSPGIFGPPQLQPTGTSRHNRRDSLLEDVRRNVHSSLPKSVWQKDERSFMLLEAVRLGYSQSVRRLLEEGADAVDYAATVDAWRECVRGGDISAGSFQMPSYH